MKQTFGKAYPKEWTPGSAIKNDKRKIFSSKTSWSRRTLIAIIAAAPKALKDNTLQTLPEKLHRNFPFL